MTVGESPDAWRDHPRVCGEHQNVRFSDDWDGGIIPAYAGNTSSARRLWSCWWDHPRVCGEHKVDDSTGEGAWGSSPRMRGTLRRAFRKFRRLGIIPAYAGNTMMTPRLTTATWDHPRVCGEHSRRGSAGLSFGGSSPRMRGTPFVVIAVTVWRGIIPAYAGNTGR